MSPPSAPGFVRVVRGGLVESLHEVHVCVADTDGRVVAACGDGEAVTYLRSAAKPFQALPLVEDGVVDALGLTAAELALCCGSHEGEPAHVAGTRSILDRAGLGESALRCGPHEPFSKEAARALAARGEEPRPVHNNCSGKHAGMLALAVHHGWDPEGYHEASHPVQRRMLAEVVRWTGVPEDDVSAGVDGCGVVCFAVPLSAMAGAYARFARAARAGEPAGRIVDAMTAHPAMVGGTGRACTRIMDRAGARAFMKLGAEGVYGGGLPGEGLGFALKVRDGGRRAVETALVAVLDALGALEEEDRDALADLARPEVRNTRGQVVGSLETELPLAVTVPR